MEKNSTRDRILEAFAAANITKAELSRRSKVPYHTIDKFLKRDGANTAADTAQALANALGVKVDGDAEYDELRELFFQLDEQQRKFLLASARGLIR